MKVIQTRALVPLMRKAMKLRIVRTLLLHDKVYLNMSLMVRVIEVISINLIIKTPCRMVMMLMRILMTEKTHAVAIHVATLQARIAVVLVLKILMPQSMRNEMH